MSLRKALYAGSIFLLASLAAGAASAKTLRIGLGEDPDVLDPTLARTFVGRIVFASLCDKLVDISPGLKIVPQLATSWQWTEGNRGLVMKLRRGVKFQDGTDFDAAAVRFNIERDLKMPGSNRKAEIGPVQDVQVIDPYTVKYVLKTPFAPLLAPLSDRAGMMVSPKAARAEGDKFGSHPVCAGPFKFALRVPQDRIVLDRFAGYWNKGAIHFDRIVFLPIPDSTVRLANLQSGGLDLMERVAATDFDGARRDARLRTASVTGLGYQGITINLNHGPRAKNPLGQDARVREALELSLDRPALNRVVFNGMFEPGNQWEPAGNPYYVKSFPMPARNLAKAKQLLAAAGVPHPSFTLMVPTNPEILRAAQVEQAMAGEAGFDIKIRATEFASSLQLASRGDFEAYQIGWSGRTDPDGNIYNFVSCHAPPALNAAHYCNAEVDQALDAARSAATPEERLADYTKVAGHTLRDRPIIYLWHPKWLYAMSKSLKGFTPYPDGLIRPQGLRMQ